MGEIPHSSHSLKEARTSSVDTIRILTSPGPINLHTVGSEAVRKVDKLLHEAIGLSTSEAQEFFILQE